MVADSGRFSESTFGESSTAFLSSFYQLLWPEFFAMAELALGIVGVAIPVFQNSIAGKAPRVPTWWKRANLN